MKQIKLTLILALTFITFFVPSAVKPSATPIAGTARTQSANIDDLTWYYWFDPYGNYLFRFCKTSDETYLTGYDPYIYNPRTLQEQGYSVSVVSFDQDGVAIMPIGLYPDKMLWSHP